MKEISSSRLEEILGGRRVIEVGEQPITGITIDSRIAEPGQLFIPLVGENYDGHDFIKEAIEKGVSAVVSEKAPTELGIDLELLKDKNITFIVTSSTMRALRRLATFNRNILDIPIIAVTGSSGKTTTKDIIASVLSQKYKVFKTPENLNNVMGVPQSLIGINEDDEIAVIEMGMDHLGEIEESIRMVSPQLAVITNIGTAHLEKLGTKENILKAKTEILSTLTDSDYALLNGDDEYLNRIKPQPFKIMRFGIDNAEVNLRAQNCDLQQDQVSFDIGLEHFSIPFPGEHNIYNALSAIGIAKMFGLTQQQIQDGLDAFTPSEHRMNMFEQGGIFIVDDTYNANPESVLAALKAFSSFKREDNRLIAVLGDMLELGEDSLHGHLEVGREAARTVDYLVGVGPNATNIIRGAINVRAGMEGKYFSNTQDAYEFLKDFLKPGDYVLFKASHGMEFSELIDKLCKDL